MSAAKLYNLNANDVILTATPLVLLPLIIGATGVILSDYTPERWIDCAARHRVTFTIAVSSQLAQIAASFQDAAVNLSALRSVVSSSALLQADVKTALLNRLRCEIYKCYGASEIAIATNLDMRDSHKVRSVGKAINGVDIYIADESGNRLEAMQKGEIYCKTDLLFKGYYHLEGKSKEALHKGYFKTGDIGFLDNDGYLYYSGRKKDLIISGGINIYILATSTTPLGK